MDHFICARGFDLRLPKTRRRSFDKLFHRRYYEWFQRGAGSSRRRSPSAIVGLLTTGLAVGHVNSISSMHGVLVRLLGKG